MEEREGEAEVQPWRPAAGKMTRTMRLARELGPFRVDRRGDGAIDDDIGRLLARLDTGGGRPLPAQLRHDLERALGRDVADVRVHTDARAAQTADALGAEAFAVGNHVYFGAGRYEPDSERGRHLIAHEVAHTVQQRSATGDAVEVSRPGDAHEREAEQFADAFVTRPAAPAPAAAPSPIVPPAAHAMITPVGRRQVQRDLLRWPSPNDPKNFVYEMPAFDLFPQRSWDKTYDIVPPTWVPIVKGVVLVGKVPVTYEAGAKAAMSAWANATVGPAQVGQATLMVDQYTYEDLVDRKIGVAQVPAGTAGKGTASFSAGASAGMSASATIGGEVAIFDAFAVGAEGGLAGGATLTNNVNVTKAVDFLINGGSARFNDSVTVSMTGSLVVDLRATAGIYVELRPPGINILSGITSALRQLPGIGMIVPDAGKFKWRKDWKKEIPLFNKTIDWNFSRKVQLLGGAPDVDGVQKMVTEDHPGLGALIDDHGKHGTSKIADDKGPDGLEDMANPSALGAARAKADGQVASAQREIQREKDWNEMAAKKLAERSAKGSSGAPSPKLATLGGDLAKHLAAVGKAMSVADAFADEVNKAQGHEGDENVAVRAEVRTAYDSVAANADTLGDAAAEGRGELARPSVTDDPAAEAAFEARLRGVQLRFDAVVDPVMMEVAWTTDELEFTDGCPEIADYRGAVAKHHERVAELDARREMLEKDVLEARTTAAGGDFPGANQELDGVEKWLGWIEGRCNGIAGQRPKRTWDEKYAAPEGGKLMLLGPYRSGRAIRERFYPGEYEPKAKARVYSQIVVQSRRDPANATEEHYYWKWDGPVLSPRGTQWWRIDILNETPTVAHNHPPVALHWNETGCGTDQAARAAFYSGLGPGTQPLEIEPWKVNVGKGAKDTQGNNVRYQHHVKISFKGP